MHIFGYPVDLLALERIADAREIPILEDACQALGAVDAEGRAVGTAGHVAAFAFYANKQMTTGEGGALVPAGEEMAEALRSERNQGRAPDMSEIDHPRIGFNYRLTDVQAAIGIAQIERLDETLAARAEVAAGYVELLGAKGGAPAGEGDPDGLVLPCADRGDEQRSWFVYTVQLPSSADRDAVIAALAAEGIQSKAYLPCIHTMPPYRERFGFKGGEFPVAEARRRPLAVAAVLHRDDRAAGRARLHGARRRARRPLLDWPHDVPLRRRPGSALPQDQLLDLLRPAPGAVRRRAVARPRPRPREAAGCSTRPRWRRCSRASTRSPPSSRAGTSSSPTGTRTSTWRSSAG